MACQARMARAGLCSMHNNRWHLVVATTPLALAALIPPCTMARATTPPALTPRYPTTPLPSIRRFLFHSTDMFSPSLTTKHTATCPWRQTACQPKLLAYVPSTTPEQLCSLFYSLADKLMRVDVLPDMDTLAIQTLRSTAMPYGSYDDFITAAAPGGGAVVGGGGAAGYSHDLAPRRRQMPSATIRELDQNGDEVMTPSGSAAGAAAAMAPAAAAGGGGDAAAVLQALVAAGDAGEGQAVLVQTSKLAPAQKARLLALLGWDVDVLQPDSASGMAVAPFAAGGSYSLSHLGVKPKAAAAAAAGAGAGGAAVPGTPGGAGGKGGKGSSKVPSSQVVLKCPICNSRMGLWNYSGVRPVPVGRLTAPPPPAAGGAAALMLSPRPAAASSGGGAAAAAAPAVPATIGSDPLSCTIAGGQYGQFGFGGAASAAKPFGSAAAAAPFRFGSAASTAPVFGLAAMDVDAQRAASAASGPFGSAAAAAAATPSMPAPSGSATPAPAGRKRKAEAPEPMALDAQHTPSAGMATPVAAPDGKRQRMAATPLWGGAGFGAVGGPAASPSGLGLGGASALAAASAAGQPRELDPVAQHRSWCPWVYTGAASNPVMGHIGVVGQAVVVAQR